MKNQATCSIGQPVGMALSLLSWHLCQGTVHANPTGATYAPGTASLHSSPSGAQLTITTPGNAYINWTHFNIDPGETTTFVEPSATSVVWNQINDPNPSQILGTINANGYVVLQNQSGFVVGGQAAINAHGLVMTTAPSTSVPNLTSGGAWSFSAPPPYARIVNYGQINITGGGSAFLIANEIVNGIDGPNVGTVSAPGGKIGLYAGETVLVSPTPDGRSLSATVTLPQGSVDNEGRLIADAGTIAAQAQTVNQNGIIQANSVQNVNGVIELVASDSLTLGAASTISAQGDGSSTKPSSGGSVTLQSANSFADLSGSTINVSGGTQGGTGGQIMIAAPQMTALNSTLNGTANSSDANGTLTIDTVSILLNADGSAAPSGLALNASAFGSGFSTINLQAADSIEVAAPLNLADKSDVIGSVSLVAGNTINVDAGGGIVADGGHISLNAATVNQNGLLQANSVGTANGAIDVAASQAINLGATSAISAQGDATSTQPSPGGFVVLQSGNTFADTAGSTINVAGQAGGQDGVIEISGNGTSASSLQSTLSSYYALLINPYDLTLSDGLTDTTTADPADATKTDPNLNVLDLVNYSQIDLRAQDNIEVAAPLNLPDATSTASVTLTAGNNLTFDPGASLLAGNNWDVNLAAGAALTAGTSPVAGSDGIYLNGGAVVQTQNGYISATAANEVIIQDKQVDDSGTLISPSGAIRTVAGGSIDVTAQLGNVYTGDSIYGFLFAQNSAPWYIVDKANLGGISTAAGGNVSITAGGSVTSYLPTQTDYNANNDVGYDGGSGAFGGGNVTITAGTTVNGNYVLANGTGMITAGGDAGVPLSGSGGFALSLVKGNWTVSAANIYLADVINPNGVFNDADTRPRTGRGGITIPSPNGPGAHLFDYDPAAAVTLDAANGVEITGADMPLTPLVPGSAPSVNIPILFPPSLTIDAGAGGITLDTDVILFPSSEGNVSLTTHNGGNFSSRLDPNNPVTYNFQMSDSAKSQFDPTIGHDEATENFGYGDHAATPPELNNPNPVDINIDGSIDNLSIYTTKQTDLTVHGNMFNGNFIGKNLHADDVTSVTVDGSISFSPLYALTTLTTPLDSSGVSQLSQVVDDSSDPNDLFSAAQPIPQSIVNLGVAKNGPALTALAQSETLQQLDATQPDLGFVYNPTTQQLGYIYQMNSTVLGIVDHPMVAIQYAYGRPLIALGQTSLGQNPALYYFVTKPVDFNPQTLPVGAASGSAPVSAIGVLSSASQGSVADAQHLPTGFQIGGPGQFTVNAGSLDLGASGGIISWGGGNGSQSVGGGVNYASLDTLTGAAGASIDVTVTGNVGMLTSTIATIGGGSVTVNSTGGEIDLGLAGVPFTPPNAGNLAFGIFSSAGGDVTVTANNDINIDTARIATFNGGTINLESFNGNVNAGNGVNEDLQVLAYYPNDPNLDTTPEITGPRPFGSGILAIAPSLQFQIPGNNGIPGDIYVTTPNGDIISTLGGISQFALNANVGAGPVVSLTAGTKGVTYIQDPSGTLKDTAGHIYYGLIVNGVFKPEGNIDLGKGGVLGGEVDLGAQGNIAGLIVSRQNTTVTAQQNVEVTVVSGGNAAVSGGSSVGGDIIANGNASVSGSDSGLAVFGESTSGSAGVANSLGTASASSSSQSAASQTSKEALTTTDTSGNDLDNKKKGQSVDLKVKRVTVILPGKPTASRQTPADAL